MDEETFYMDKKAHAWVPHAINILDVIRVFLGIVCRRKG